MFDDSILTRQMCVFASKTGRKRFVLHDDQRGKILEHFVSLVLVGSLVDLATLSLNLATFSFVRSDFWLY